MAYSIGIDCGGTFTDCVVVNDEGEFTWGKAPSTPGDFSAGVINSVTVTGEGINISAKELLKNTHIFGHGTTVAINALLTRRGSKTGLITTRGFEDTLIIGRIHQKVAGLNESELINVAELDKADPVIPRSLIKGVRERVDYKGQIISPLNHEEVRQAVKSLVDEGAEAIAVCLLWSFMNQKHELEIEQIINEAYPNIFVTLSSKLAPVIKEYERMATTSINAYLGKITANYISTLDQKLKETNLQYPLLIMQGMGGFTSAQEARERPILTISSGPVGGIIGSRTLAEILGYDNVISTDVGGTSFDVGLLVKRETPFAQAPVYAKYRLCIPMIDTVSIGAGGGSIAWVEAETGLLKVGPRSAGAVPGPVCYDKGGTEPAVTDADLVLNRYNPDFFLGGRMKLNRAKAVAAIEEKIAKPLKMKVEDAAMGIVRVVDSQMADLVRKATVGRGYDPRNFIILAYGSAGPSHAGSYAFDAGGKLVVIPRLASVFSAFGVAVSDIIHKASLSEPMRVPLDVKRLKVLYEKLEKDILATFTREGTDIKDVVLTRTMDLRYRGQVHELEALVPGGGLGPEDMNKVVDHFEKVYEDRYGKGTAYKAAGIEAITYRITGIKRIPKPVFTKHKLESEDASHAIKDNRKVYFSESGGYTLTRIYDRNKLRAGNVVGGPAIIEVEDTTVVIHPEQTARVDEYLNIVMQCK